MNNLMRIVNLFKVLNKNKKILKQKLCCWNDLEAKVVWLRMRECVLVWNFVLKSLKNCIVALLQVKDLRFCKSAWFANYVQKIVHQQKTYCTEKLYMDQWMPGVWRVSIVCFLRKLFYASNIDKFALHHHVSKYSGIAIIRNRKRLTFFLRIINVQIITIPL